jgi:type II secretory pathway pseudopilin PulG
MLLKVFSQKGDTIIEVMMSIVIVSAVITGAYGLASNSLQTGIAATENTEATKIIESQIEALKLRKHNTLPQDWDNTFAGAQNFCLNDAAVAQYNSDGDLDASWLPQQNSGGETNLVRGAPGPGYNSLCTDPATGAAKYFVNIKASATSPTQPAPTYQISVRWTPPGDGPQKQLQMYYRF